MRWRGTGYNFFEKYLSRKASMISRKIERRAAMYRNGRGEKFDAAVVRQGILLKLEGNTISAVEYMTNRGVASAIIQRVLSGTAWRADDIRAAGSLEYAAAG